MKRIAYVFLAVVFVLAFARGCVFLGGTDVKIEVGKKLKLDLKEAIVGTDRDTHGGFHGDGVRFVVLDCSARPMGEEIASTEGWKPLPVSENVGILLYGGSGWAPVAKIDDYDAGVFDEPLFPVVTNGWYYFYDRHDSAKDRYSDANVLSRYSFNFTVALYDSDTDTLYFCKLDT